MFGKRRKNVTTLYFLYEIQKKEKNNKFFLLIYGICQNFVRPCLPGEKNFKKWDFVILHKLPIVHFFSSQKSLHIMLHVSPPPFPYSMGSGGGEEEERRRRGGGGRWLSFRKDSIQFRKTLLITRTFLHIYIIQYMQSHALLFSDREKKIYTSN